MHSSVEECRLAQLDFQQTSSPCLLLHPARLPLFQSAQCCAVLCYAVLCCAVLCCAVLCCAVLCCAVLCCAALCHAMPCHTLVLRSWTDCIGIWTLCSACSLDCLQALHAACICNAWCMSDEQPQVLICCIKTGRDCRLMVLKQHRKRSGQHGLKAITCQAFQSATSWQVS